MDPEETQPEENTNLIKLGTSSRSKVRMALNTYLVELEDSYEDTGEFDKEAFDKLVEETKLYIGKDVSDLPQDETFFNAYRNLRNEALMGGINVAEIMEQVDNPEEALTFYKGIVEPEQWGTLALEGYQAVLDEFETETAEDFEQKKQEYEARTGQVYVPSSFEEIPGSTREKKIENFIQLVTEPFIEVSPGRYYRSTDEDAYNAGQVVEYFNDEEVYAEKENIYNTLKDTPEFQQLMARPQVIPVDPNDLTLGYNIVRSPGTEFEKTFNETPLDKATAESVLPVYTEQTEVYITGIAEGLSYEDFVKESEMLDEALMREKEAAKAQSEIALGNFMANNYINWVDEDTFNEKVEAIADEETTLAEVQKEYTDQLILKYPGMEEKLRQGQTFKSVADFYINSMASILEVAPDAINLDDPTLQSALSYKDAQGNYTLKPVYEMEREIKLNDERYRYTKKARTDMANLARAVAEDLGAR